MSFAAHLTFALVLATTAIDAEPPLTTTPAASAAALEAEVRAGVEAFGERRFETALTHFEAASKLTDDPLALSDLHFNAAVCLFELGSHEQAERRFVAIAEAEASHRSDEAWLYAGFAALRQSALTRAESHAKRATPDTAATKQLASRLAVQLDEARRLADGDATTARLREGLSLLDQQRLDEAEQVLTRVATGEHVHPSERAAALHALAAIAQARGDSSRALVHLTSAISESPNSPELYLSRARVHAALDEPERAKRDYHAAERLLDASAPVDAERLADLRDEAAQLYLLPESGWFLRLGLGAGFDSNITQSGTAASFLTATARISTASPFVTANADVGRSLRLHELWALTPAYRATALAFTQSEARDLSIVVHDLGLDLRRAVSFDTSASLGAGARYATSGLDGMPFTFQVYARLGTLWRHSLQWSGSAVLEYHRQIGLSGQSALTGHGLDVSLREQWTRGALSLGAELGVLVYWLGTQELNTTETCDGGPPVDVPIGGPDFGAPDRDGSDEGNPNFSPQGLGGVCAPSTLSNPLSYVAPRAGAHVELQASRWVALTLFSGFEYKRYSHPSTFSQTALVVSQRDRRDRRLQLGLQANLELATLAGASLFARYTLHIVRSNVALDTTGWRRAFADGTQADGDHSAGYEQHVPELGVSYRF